VLEIHPWGSRISDLERPDRLIFDLDPGEGIGWKEVVQAAREVRDRLAAHRLESFVKTSGGKGLHVVIPITPAVGWDTAKSFTKGIAEQMSADSPARFLSVMTKAKRHGRIFVDYLRNGRGATSVAAYSTRARSGAPVSTPLTWGELDQLTSANSFTIDNIPARLKSVKRDPWAGFFEIKQKLPTASASRKRLATSAHV
jgi:bifunctional non-homologous end joining protein LigD